VLPYGKKLKKEGNLMQPQFEQLKDILKACGLTVLQIDESEKGAFDAVEADDVIGTAARIFSEHQENIEILIASGDKDLRSL